MTIEPSLEEQQLLAESVRRARSRLTSRERLAEVPATLGFVAAVVALWLARPPHDFDLFAAAICTVVLALASMVRFETPFGFTVPTQLGFVPLLFAVPLALVPIATVIALAAARLPVVLRGELRPSRLVLTVGNAWFSIGAMAVFAFADVEASQAGAALLIGALAAQFLVDFAVSAVRVAVAHGGGLSVQLRDSWVYGVDAALSGVAYEVARNVRGGPGAALTLIPLLGLFAVFARERHARLGALLELNRAYRGTALVLGDVVEADDGYTGEHSRGVVALALEVADRLHLPADARRNVEFGALLHDIGKITIPKDVINKPGKLDRAEWTLVKTHTVEGQKILDRVGGFMHEVGLIVRSHHERWDGGGYPDGLAGEAIPLGARIIACCDTWNAMRTDRVYRKALSHEDAVTELMASAGSQLDPEIVEVLLAIVAPGEVREPERTPRPASPPSSQQLGASPAVVEDSNVDDVRAADPVARLLEDSWESRPQRANRRELASEAVAGALFLALAVPWALPPLLAGRLHPGLALLLVAVYALARMIKFPIGAGYVVPSYLVLVSMLQLLPPSTVPLLAAGALVAGAGLRVLLRQGSTEELLFSIPDAWHALGPAAVIALAGPVHGIAQVAVYVAALTAGLVLDLVVSTLRESLAQAVPPTLQARVIAFVWLVDGSMAPLGLLAAQAARIHPARLALIIPLIGLLKVVDRDRNARINEAQRRLALVRRERTRLQAAVQRLGDALACRLDLSALTDVLLRGSIDALDADAGQLLLHPQAQVATLQRPGQPESTPLLESASAAARANGEPHQLEAGGVWALALPLSNRDRSTGALAVARRDRAFRHDEQTLLLGLVERAERAVSEILAHDTLREQAVTDPLTRLGNRRKLAADLSDQTSKASESQPLLLMMFDLNGFKNYNDTFGHVAGDALLARLGQKLASAVATEGAAYRLGGDEFCVLLPAGRDTLQDAVAAAAAALEEHGEKFAITAACGTVLIPHEARTVDYALQLADERMYSRKRGARAGAREQAHDVLIHIMRAKKPALLGHDDGVAPLAVAVGCRLGMRGEELDELGRAATLHDVGKVGVPDAILTKPGPLDPEEWSFIRQHPVLGERILSAAPALRPVATIVRATHERWDGAGYPDHLRAEQIPLAARIIAVCDAYQAMTRDRCHKPAMTPQAARLELTTEAGHQFDPHVVEACLHELDQPTTVRGSRDQTADADRRALAAEVASHVHDLLQSPAT